MTPGEIVEHVKLIEKMGRHELLSEAHKLTVDELRYSIVQVHAHRLQQAMMGSLPLHVIKSHE